VINQLTRYYDALIQEKPFKNKVDYQQDILLYAICPIFHQHNLIDVKHTALCARITDNKKRGKINL
jgi:hypothetical protein